MKYSSPPPSGQPPRRQKSGIRKITLSWLLLLCCSGLIAGFAPTLIHGLGTSAVAQSNVKQQEDRVIRDFALPSAPSQAPVYQPQPAPAADPEPASEPAAASPSAAPSDNSQVAAAPASKSVPEKTSSDTDKPSAKTRNYSLTFNRSPIVGNRLRLQGVYSEARLGFTRPRNWKLKSAKALIRFQHSPALLPNRSNLTVRINNTSVGSTPLNRRRSQIGEFLVTIPTNLVQEFNEISVVGQQNNKECSNSSDPALWTEVLPDSKLIFEYEPQPISLDFSRFPYPFFDDTSPDATRLAYVPPAKISDAWLTAAGRFQAMMGRVADYRPLETRMAKDAKDLEWNDRLIVIGTPAEQPILKSLKLPFAITNEQVVDGKKNALPNDVGILMMASTPDNGNPVLIATGNGPEGVEKAVQFLAQPNNRQLGTGQAMLVNDLEDVPSPELRDWPRFIPTANSFKLSDLKTVDNQPFKDVTVRGSSAPPVEFDFRALPDDRFTRGSAMTLVYSYGPQMNSRESAINVAIDGVAIGGKRLTSDNGATRETLAVNLPENLIKPNSKIQVSFQMNPKNSAKCGVVTDQQLWGTLHTDTSFKLNRENSVSLPDLKLLPVGYPFAAPQDLSSLAIVVPDSPSNTDLLTLLEFSERMGRLSQADSIKLTAHTTATLPEDVRKERNLVGIGTRDKFPFPEALQPQSRGFSLGNLFGRQSDKGQIQTLPDNGGVIKQVMSPWNDSRVLLALSGQTENGLRTVEGVVRKDLWFYKLKGDTTLVSLNKPNAPDYDPDAYTLEFLEQAPQRRIEQTSLLSKASRVLQDNWLLLPTGIVALSLVLYGIAQLYLKRIAGDMK